MEYFVLVLEACNQCSGVRYSHVMLEVVLTWSLVERKPLSSSKPRKVFFCSQEMEINCGPKPEHVQIENL